MKTINPFRFIYENPIQPIIYMNYSKYFLIGDIRRNKYNEEFVIIDYIDHNNIIVMFLDNNKGITKTTFHEMIHLDTVNPYHYDEFYNNYIGEGVYNEKRYLKIYTIWSYMFICHNNICNEWYNFQNFAYWYDNYISSLNIEYYRHYELDKDILQWNSPCKVYSPNTCCLVPKEINKALYSDYCKKRKCDYDLPKGVYKRQDKHIFYTTISKYGKHINLGTYSSPEEAFEVYRYAKKEYIRELANKYYSINAIKWNVYHALYNIEILPY